MPEVCNLQIGWRAGRNFVTKIFPVCAENPVESECVYRKIYLKNERQPADILTISTEIQAKNRTVFLKDVP